MNIPTVHGRHSISWLSAGDFSILLVEQNLKLAFEVADYVYVMSKGTVVYESKPQELEANDEIKVKYLGV